MEVGCVVRRVKRGVKAVVWGSACGDSCWEEGGGEDVVG